MRRADVRAVTLLGVGVALQADAAGGDVTLGSDTAAEAGIATPFATLRQRTTDGDIAGNGGFRRVDGDARRFDGDGLAAVDQYCAAGKVVLDPATVRHLPCHWTAPASVGNPAL